MISFAHPEQLGLAADLTQSFVLDNGAFSAWTSGEKYDFAGYIDWVRQWYRHPGLDWVVIPDVIDGDETKNDELLAAWPEELRDVGTPVWHLHESLDRLDRLVQQYPRVALGSSGQFATVGDAAWWKRMTEAMEVACDEDGLPKARLHGLRMLNPAVFSQLPLASADSCNVAVNSCREGKRYKISPEGAALIMANRIELHTSAPRWTGGTGIQMQVDLG